MAQKNDQRTVLITGGAHRLGAALVRAFAANGWRVFLHYGTSRMAAEQLADSLNLAGKTSQLVTCVQADLASESERKAMMDVVYSQAPHLDCLINNASQFEADSADAFDATEAARQWSVNLMAPLDLTQILARKNTQAGHATSCVIHVLDQKVFNLNPDYFSYTVGKLALERTVALQAQALAPRVRVCGVAPGLMYLSGPQSEANFEIAASMNLMQKAIDPADVASTCLFLAQNPAITGTTLCVDNGQHLVASNRDVMFVAQEKLESNLESKKV
jgi:NAD(P)-dependent dehydrogenase (short-subunit alcohol dehydrogenase family)